MARIRNEIGRHPRLGFSLLLAVGLAVIAVLIPFSYRQTVGYTVDFEGIDSAYQPQDQILSHALETIGYSDARIYMDSHGNTFDCRIDNLYSELDAKKVSAVFAAVTGYQLSARIEPVVREVSASLYAQVKDKIARIELETKGKTDDEIESEIRVQLKQKGIESPVVTVRTLPDGQRRISVDFEDSTDSVSTEKKLQIITGDSVISLKDSSSIAIDVKGKTNEEITAEIRRQLEEKGFKNPDIKVTTDENGQRQIELKIEKEED